MVIVNFITPCIRHQNLEKILKSFKTSLDNFTKQFKQTVLFEWIIEWYIVFDQRLLKKSSEDLIEVVKFLDFKDSPGLSLKWLIFKETGSPINLALRKIEKGFVCVIDDDNIVHPDFFTEIFNFLRNKTDLDIGVLFHQDLGNSNIREANLNLIKPGSIDTAQFLISRELIQDVKWGDFVTHYRTCSACQNSTDFCGQYCPDAEFIGKVFSRNKDKFFVINKTLCYYNYLNS